MAKKRQTPLVKTSFWDQLPNRTRHIICLLFLLILPTILYHQVVWGNMRMLGSDLIQWRASAQALIQAKKQYHTEPLWDTNMFSGMPAYLIYFVKSVPNIDTIIFGIFSFIYPAAQFWILLGGLYFFFWLQDIKPLSATLGAILIGFTTYIPIIIGAGHNTQFLAFLFMPWVLSGYWLLTRKEDHKLLSFFLFGLALILELRAQHPQVTYYFLYLLGIWWVHDVYKAWKNQKLGEWSQITLLLAAAAVIAVLANAQPYWSIYQYSHFSNRGTAGVGQTGGLNISYAMSWSQGWGELLTLAIPGLYGGSSANGSYWGPKPFTAGPHYLGAIAVLLLVIGIFKSKRPTKSVFLFTGVLSMLFSLGSNFKALNYFMFHYIPWFNKFRTPEMWLILTVFCFSTIAVYGLEWIIDQITSSKKQELKDLFLPVGIVVAFALIMTLGSTSMFSFEKPGEIQQIEQAIAQQNHVSVNDARVAQAADRYMLENVIPKRQSKARSDSLRLLIFVLIGCVLILAAYNGKIPWNLAVIGLIILASVDMLSVGARYFGKQDMAPKKFDFQSAIEQQRTPRDTWLQDSVKTAGAWSWRVFPADSNPFQNAIPCYFYPSIGGYTGAKLGIYNDLIDSAITTKSGLNTGVLDMLNVKYLTYGHNIPLPGFKEVYQGKDGVIMENENVLPKAFYVDSLVYAPTHLKALEGVAHNFNPHKYAIVESAQNLSSGTDSTAKVKITTYRPGKIVMKTNRNNNGFLVLSEIYYPAGWKADIDGNPATIYKTDYVLRGLSIPAGSHTVTLRFNPVSYTAGKTLAWIFTILIYVIGIAGLVMYFKSSKATNDE